MRLFFRAALIFLGTALLSTTLVNPAEAQSIPAALVKVKTERYQPGKIQFPQGVYDYDIAWQGLPIATGRIEVQSEHDLTEPVIKVTADCWSARGMSWLYNLKHRTESVFYSSSFQPVRFLTTQVENSRENISAVNFLTDGHVQSRRWKNGKPNGEDDFTTENPIMDPVTATFLARSLPFDVGSEVAFDVYNGKHRFLIKMKLDARERIKVGTELRDAYRIIPTVEKLTDPEGGKKFKSATLWVSADDRRDVLKIESRVLIGRVTAMLRSYAPAGSDSPATPSNVRAQLSEMVRAVNIN